jgi:ferredoxin
MELARERARQKSPRIYTAQVNTAAAGATRLFRNAHRPALSLKTDAVKVSGLISTKEINRGHPMSSQSETLFENFLNQQDEEAWSEALTTLLRTIHEVDKTATQIWFAFYPLGLYRALQQSEDREALARKLLLQGNYSLRDQIDSSHRFLYGHRFWPQVKTAVAAHAASFAEPKRTDLAEQILHIARSVSAQLKVNESLLAGITAVAFMTIQQAGLAAFKAAPGTIEIPAKRAKKSPEQILKERAKDDGQGILGFLKTVDKEWTVNFDEDDAKSRFMVIQMEDLAAAAARDRSRDWRALDPRCIEGPIPVECRSASCGTCWVGVLGGAEKLSDVSAREGKKIKEFGYIETTEPRPIIRLACMAQATGAVSIVIPPWNGVFGKYLRAREEEARSTVVQEPKAAGNETSQNPVN